MKGGETVSLQTIGNISFHNHNVLDVVTNGSGQFLCVRANDNEDVHDTQYWMVIAKGRDGKDGKDGKDGTDADVSISDKGTWIINGKDTGKSVPIPSFQTKTLSDGTDLNDVKANGSYYGSMDQAANAPSKDAGGFIMQVAGTTDNGMQQVTKVDDGSTWIRTWKSGTWTDWRQATQWN